jgi:hypothetical protein
MSTDNEKGARLEQLDRRLGEIYAQLDRFIPRSAQEVPDGFAEFGMSLMERALWNEEYALHIEREALLASP